jgi:hypothetical protein
MRVGPGSAGRDHGVGMRIRDWTIALSAAAVFGVLVGGVYSGVTGWTGPSVRAAVTGSSEASLPGPAERPGSPAATAPVDARSAPAPIGERAAPERVKPAKAKADKGKPDKGKPDEGKPDEGKPTEAEPDEAGKPAGAEPEAAKPAKDRHGKKGGRD